MNRIICQFVLGLLAYLPFGVAYAQPCPTGPQLAASTSKNIQAFVALPVPAPADEMNRLARQVRAHMILLWNESGRGALENQRSGLVLLAQCYKGNCGLANDPVSKAGIYDFVNRKQAALPAVFASPPPSTALDWARGQLACSGNAVSKAQSKPQSVSSPAPQTNGAAANSLNLLERMCAGQAGEARLSGEACFRLGQAYIGRVEGVTVDDAKAQVYFKKSCELGFAAGCFNYGGALKLYGKTPEEKALGIEFIGKACDLGDASSCFNYEAFSGTKRKK